MIHCLRQESQPFLLILYGPFLLKLLIVGLPCKNMRFIGPPCDYSVETKRPFFGFTQISLLEETVPQTYFKNKKENKKVKWQWDINDSNCFANVAKISFFYH